MRVYILRVLIQQYCLDRNKFLRIYINALRYRSRNRRKSANNYELFPSAVLPQKEVSMSNHSGTRVLSETLLSLKRGTTLTQSCS